jgi:flagellin-like protein
MRYTETKEDSGVSPVIGVVLMVAIAVILSAVIGTFVLGLGEATSAPTNAGVSIEQEPNESVTVTVTNPGNLDGLRIVAPDGSKSGIFRRGELLRAGLEIEMRNGGFVPSEVIVATDGDGNAMNLVHGEIADGAGPKYPVPGDQRNQLSNSDDFAFTDDGSDYAPVNESCKVQAPADPVRGISLNGVGAASTPKGPEIGCSLLNLEGFLRDLENYGMGDYFFPTNPNVAAGDPPIVDDESAVEKLADIRADTGTAVNYMPGEYQLVGVVDGKENVFQTFTVEEG